MIEAVPALIRKGVRPTLQAIANHLGVKSRTAVHTRVVAMEKRGLIRRSGSRRTGMLYLVTIQDAASCPGCGMVLATEARDGDEPRAGGGPSAVVA